MRVGICFVLRKQNASYALVLPVQYAIFDEILLLPHFFYYGTSRLSSGSPVYRFPAINHFFSSEYVPTTMSAPAARSADAEKLVVRPAEKHPAALAAAIPFTASSITKHAVGARPSLS